jgi:PAS domain S-box-containing protein
MANIASTSAASQEQSASQTVSRSHPFLSAYVSRLMKENVDLETRWQDGIPLPWHLIEHCLGLICIHDFDGMILAVNPAACEALGYEPGALIGRHLYQYLAPSAQPLFQEYLLQAKQHPTNTGLMRVMTSRGIERMWTYRSVTYAESGSEAYVIGHALDITERMQNEHELKMARDELEIRNQRLQTLTHLSRVVSSSLDLAEVLREITQAAGLLMNAHIAAFWMADEARQTLERCAFWSVQEQTEFPLTTLAYTQGAIGWVATHQCPLNIPHVFSDARVLGKEWYEAHHLRTFYGLPMHLNGLLLAVLAFAGDAPFCPSNFDDELLRTFIGHAAVAIHNAQLFARLQQQSTQLVEANAALEQEICDRQRVEKTLRDSEARKTAIFESALDCMITMNHDGRIVEFNPAAERTFGYNRHQVIGQKLSECIIPPQLRAQHERSLATYLQTGRGKRLGKQIETLGMRADGSTFPVEIAVIPLHVGAQPLFTSFVRDITERKEIECLKDELVSTVSHELRTPLASLRGFAELMLQRDFPVDKQREFLTIIRNESVRLTTLVNDFLDLQRLNGGHQLYRFSSLDFLPLVQEALAVFQQEASQHRLCLEVRTTVPMIRGDSDRLRQVLTNLLSNAVKFSPQGSTITVGIASEPSHIVVRVTDQGIGIPEDSLGKLFSKFYRVDNAATRRIGGTGLGLALVKEIVEAHEGRVWVKSTYGAGSTFYFTLPVAEAAVEGESRHTPVGKKENNLERLTSVVPRLIHK